MIYDVASVVTAPSFNLSGHLENDLAVVRLSLSVTGVTPVPFYITGTSELNQTITLIGYGFTGTGLTGGTTADSQRRGANNVIDALDASSISADLNLTSYLTRLR